MRMTSPIIWLICAFACAAASAQEAPADDLLLRYHWSGGLSPYHFIEINIDRGGALRAKWQKLDRESDYSLQLTAEEKAALITLIRASGVLEQPADAKPLPPAIDRGTVRLRVRLDGADIESTPHVETIAPLDGFLWKVIQQGEMLREVETGGDLYQVHSSLSPRAAAPRVLRPRELVDPLMKFAQTTEDYTRLKLAIESLADLITPEQFLGLVARIEREEGPRRRLLLVMLHSGMNLPPSHAEALAPFYLAYLKRNGQRERMEDYEHNAVSACARCLGDLHYAPAVPTFVEMLRAVKQPYVDASLSQLGRLGMEGLGAVLAELDNPNENVRVCAIELLHIASYTGPRSGSANPVPAHEWEIMLNTFHRTIIPTLQRLAASDPSPLVQKKARETMEKIKPQLKPAT